MRVERTTVTLVRLELTEAEHDVIVRALHQAAPQDAQARNLCAALGASPVRGTTQHEDLPAVDLSVRIPREPIDPESLPPEDPRRIEWEAMNGRYPGTAQPVGGST